MNPPKVLQTDDGGEFFNKDMKTFLNQKQIRHFHTNQDVKAQIVERFNRTLRERIYKYMTFRKSLRYIDILPDLLLGYNSKPHGAFNQLYSPKEINKKNEQEIYQLQYGAYLAQIPKKHKYDINDIVLVAISIHGQNTFAKRTKTFGNEHYQIIDTINSNPPTYKLKRLKDGMYIDRSYYEEELQQVTPPDWYNAEKKNITTTERPSYKIKKLNDNTLIDRFKPEEESKI